MHRSISIFGLGYVGSVTAACLAKLGHRVIGVDPNPLKVQLFEAGQSPILEPGLDEMVRSAKDSGTLAATHDAAKAVLESEISFISVGTPSQRNGKLDLSHVESVCRDLGTALRSKKSFHWIVLRSTVLPGTTDNIVIPLIEATSGKRAGYGFGVCFNPEFLREGTAIADFFEPPFTVLGAGNRENLSILRELYDWAPGEIFETSSTTAEMVKYVCNSFHALKVSFANEIGAICKQLGVDAETVTRIYTNDTRLNISKAYLTPGFAFGGSCLPKDLRALMYRAKEMDLKLPLLENIMPSNNEHIERAVQTILSNGKRKIAMLGLSFKAGTDDLRESPMVQLAKRLLGEGCQLSIWDKNVRLGQLIGSNRQFIQDTIPHIGSLLSDDMDQVIAGAEVVVVGTKGLAKESLLAKLHEDQIIIDIVNVGRSTDLAQRRAYAGMCW
jgi:GDP-mannose 6-dehydrogenase